MGWPRWARTRASGEPVGSGEEDGSSWQCAPGSSHQACQEHEWFLPYSRGGVERGGRYSLSSISTSFYAPSFYDFDYRVYSKKNI